MPPVIPTLVHEESPQDLWKKLKPYVVGSGFFVAAMAATYLGTMMGSERALSKRPFTMNLHLLDEDGNPAVLPKKIQTI